MTELLFIIIGYLSGSVLYSRIVSRLLRCGDITENSADQNPGSTNAFCNGGFCCGALTLLGDIGKGFLPVWCYLHIAQGQMDGVLFGTLLAVPVIGHIFPVFYRFRGGKGIATTFGCLLGLLPCYEPVLTLAFWFLIFSVVVKIRPNYYLTLASFSFSNITLLVRDTNSAILFGFTLIVCTVGIRLLTSSEEKEKCKVNLLWMH